MNNLEQEKLTELLTGYIDGQLTEKEMAETSQWIASNEEIKSQYLQLKVVLTSLESSDHTDQGGTSSQRMEARYEQWLDQVQVNSKPRFLTIRSWYKIAAAALILIIGLGGMTMHALYVQRQELAKVQFELEQTKQVVMAKLNNTQSASQRISAVYSTDELGALDQEILQLLIKTMNEDPSSNVRIACLDALSKYYRIPQVRTALIQSMKFQNDPVVQIALIQLLVQRKEKIIIGDLQNITVQNGIIKAVKDEAYKGIFKLT
ncbi:MAG: HEAT repeat domain-containing protein [Saprospiraceae bacterium]